MYIKIMIKVRLSRSAFVKEGVSRDLLDQKIFERSLPSRFNN
jgi:hypothetical protein